MRRLIQATAMAMALALAAFGLVACGSDSDEDQIKDVVERGLNDNDPSICTEVFSQSFLEEQTGETGEDAVKSCEDSTEDSDSDPSENIEVSNIEIDGESATADIAYENDGEEFDESVDLVKEDGDWKVDGGS